MKFKKISFLLFLALPFYLYSLEIPERPLGRVSDYAKILKPEEISTIEAILLNYERETTNQIVIAIFKSLEGWDIEDFSIRLAEKWKIGQKGKDNGIIIVVAMKERKVRIEVGYGLEGVVPDITARQIIDREIAPHFRKSDYFNGLRNGVDALIKAIGGEYKVEKGKSGEVIVALIILFIVMVFLLQILAGLSYGLTYTRSKGRWHRRYSVWDSFWGGFFGGWGSGGGFSGGGFSGGGGSFGGGGATGSW